MKVRKDVSVPTLILWGDKDPALDQRCLDDLPERVPQARLERFADAGHFVHWDEPERVASLLFAFFSK